MESAPAGSRDVLFFMLAYFPLTQAGAIQLSLYASTFQQLTELSTQLLCNITIIKY